MLITDTFPVELVVCGTDCGIDLLQECRRGQFTDRTSECNLFLEQHGNLPSICDDRVQFVASVNGRI